MATRCSGRSGWGPLQQGRLIRGAPVVDGATRVVVPSKALTLDLLAWHGQSLGVVPVISKEHHWAKIHMVKTKDASWEHVEKTQSRIQKYLWQNKNYQVSKKGRIERVGFFQVGCLCGRLWASPSKQLMKLNEAFLRWNSRACLLRMSLNLCWRCPEKCRENHRQPSVGRGCLSLGLYMMLKQRHWFLCNWWS